MDVTGVFDASTQDAVETVQEAAGWEPSGRLDANTWGVIWTLEAPKGKHRKKEAAKKKHPSTRSAFKRPFGK
jgi:peptidoglycan hydrolase-like protein with peptidoglycan-binding domain